MSVDTINQRPSKSEDLKIALQAAFDHANKNTFHITLFSILCTNLQKNLYEVQYFHKSFIPIIIQNN